MTKRNRLRRSRAGLSLTELLVSLAVMMLLLGSLGIVTMQSRGAYEENAIQSDLDALARRAIGDLAEELIAADRSTIDLDPDDPFPATGISYQRGQGWGGSQLLLSPRRSIRLELVPGELDDGIDNNGNGLADECRIVLTPDEDDEPDLQVTRTNWVRELLEGELPNGLDDNGNGVADEGGLFVTHDPTTGLVTIELTLERRNANGRLVTRTARTTVRARND